MDVVSLVSAYVHNPAELAFFLFIVQGWKIERRGGGKAVASRIGIARPGLVLNRARWKINRSQSSCRHTN